MTSQRNSNTNTIPEPNWMKEDCVQRACGFPFSSPAALITAITVSTRKPGAFPTAPHSMNKRKANCLRCFPQIISTDCPCWAENRLNRITSGHLSLS